MTEGFHCPQGSADCAKLKSMPTYKTPVFGGQKSGKKGDITDFPYAVKLVILHQLSELSTRLPTAEVDKFTKQPTYNIHKSINNKGTRQQYKHTESELPGS